MPSASVPVSCFGVGCSTECCFNESVSVSAVTFVVCWLPLLLLSSLFLNLLLFLLIGTRFHILLERTTNNWNSCFPFSFMVSVVLSFRHFTLQDVGRPKLQPTTLLVFLVGGGCFRVIFNLSKNFIIITKTIERKKTTTRKCHLVTDVYFDRERRWYLLRLFVNPIVKAENYSFVRSSTAGAG